MSRTGLRTIKNTIEDVFCWGDVVLSVGFTGDFDDLDLHDDKGPIDLQEQDVDIFQVLTDCCIFLPQQWPNLLCNTMVQSLCTIG